MQIPLSKYTTKKVSSLEIPQKENYGVITRGNFKTKNQDPLNTSFLNPRSRISTSQLAMYFFNTPGNSMLPILPAWIFLWSQEQPHVNIHLSQLASQLHSFTVHILFLSPIITGIKFCIQCSQLASYCMLHIHRFDKLIQEVQCSSGLFLLDLQCLLSLSVPSQLLASQLFPDGIRGGLLNNHVHYVTTR